MTNLTTDVRSEILLEKTDLWYEQQHYRGCQMVSQFATPADNLGTVRYHLGEMSPSESRTVKIVYRVTT